MRRVISILGVLLLAVTGYAVADAHDVVPGILTLDRPVAVPTPTVSGTPAPVILPSPAATWDAILQGTGSLAPVPTAAGLATAVAKASKDPALQGGVGISIRDGVTGEELWALDADTPRVPASTAKVLSALAVVDTLDLDATMKTAVLAPPGSTDLVLVVGGDTLLSPDAGEPGSVVGRAGLGDLATQVVDSLAAGGKKKVRVRLDLGYAPGQLVPTSWNPDDVREGFTDPVAMTGLATQRARPGRPSPSNPAREVADAFTKALAARGVPAQLLPEKSWTTPAPVGAQQLGVIESATYRDVLVRALDVSDNALMENLVRQAAAAASRPTTHQGDNAAYVMERLEVHGVPRKGLLLKDASGLSPGQAVTAETLSDVLRLAVTDSVPGFRGVIADLPVAGLSGTLAGRFDDSATGDVAGVPRAKTGTLRAGSALAGTTVDADGRPLTFVVLVDDFPQTYGGTLRARAALDRIVAALTRCGCR